MSGARTYTWRERFAWGVLVALGTVTYATFPADFTLTMRAALVAGLIVQSACLHWLMERLNAGVRRGVIALGRKWEARP